MLKAPSCRGPSRTNLNRLLASWTKTGASWNERFAGTPWADAGAAAGSDYASTPSATAVLSPVVTPVAFGG